MWFWHAIVSDIIYAGNLVINVYRYAGDGLVSVGEAYEGCSAVETGIGDIDRLARTVAKGNRFAGILDAG
jgi:hypothetical protein